MRALPALFLVISLFHSCAAEEACDRNMESILVARFKRTGMPVSDTVINGVTIYGIDGMGNKGLLYDSMRLSRVVLPLDANNDHSVFVVAAGGKIDTLEIRHENEIYLVSYACGFAMRFSINEIVYNGLIIDSAEIIEQKIDVEMLTDEEHIWLYL